MPATGFAIEDIDALVIDGTVPLGWNLPSSKVTYGLIDKLFVSLEKNCLPQTNKIDIIARLVSIDKDHVSKIIKKPSNLKRNISRVLSKGKDVSSKVFTELYDSKPLTPNCLSFGTTSISFATLRSIVDGSYVAPCGFEKITLKNKYVLDFLDAKNRLNATWVDFKHWLVMLCVNGDEFTYEESLRSAVLRVKEKCTDFKRRGKDQELEAFVNNIFIVPMPKYKNRVDNVLQGKVPDISAKVEQQSNIISLLLEKVTESENRISYLVEEINREKSQRGQVFDYANSLKKALHVAIEEKNQRIYNLERVLRKLEN